MEVVVVFDYVAQETDELSLKKGDVILNVVKVQEGWCQGMLNDKKGMFPDNFVKEMKKPEKQKEVVGHKKSNNSSVEDIRNKISNVINNPPPTFTPLPTNAPKKNTKQAKVLFDYEPQNDDELPLEIGQVIDIINEVEPGWWEGSLGGKVGMLPSNFVEVCTIPPHQEGNLTGDPKASPTPAEYEEVPEIKGRKVMGVGFGPNIFGKGEIVLKATNRGLPATTVAIVTSSQPTNHTNPSNSPHIITPPIITPHINTPINPPSISSAASGGVNKKKPMAPPEKDAKPVMKAKVVYSYKAENPDELSLQVGDVIQVLSQEVEDVGWWRGEVRGKSGVFPDNFVNLLPQQEPRAPLNKPKKPLEAPILKPFINLSKPKNYILAPKPSESPDSNKIKTEFMVNKGPPKRPPVMQEVSRESVRTPPIFNKAKKWETQDQLVNNVAPPQPSSLPTSQVPSTSISPISASRNLTHHQQPHKQPHQQPHQTPHQTPHQIPHSQYQQLHQSLVPKLSKNPSPSNQVSPEMMGSLQRDVVELKDGLERMKRDHEKNLLNLMAEIDDEKKTRFNMQVEIDRLKKLLSSFSTLEQPSVTKAL